MTDKYKQIADDLKKEYFGIDQQIDDIVNTFEMWLTTKEYLIRPQILNLVGPSGLGKTAVIKEVINRLNLNDDKIYLKFNNKTTSVTEEFNMCTKSDHIFVLDEMQYIKSINENGFFEPKTLRIKKLIMESPAIWRPERVRNKYMVVRRVRPNEYQYDRMRELAMKAGIDP